MITTIVSVVPKTVGLKVSGRLHDDDFRQFVTKIESILTANGNVRLFIQFEDFHGWDLYAALDELKFSLKHYSDFKRIAIVGDRKWEKWMAGFCKPFTKAKVKYFDKSEIDAAWNWLEEDDDGWKWLKEEDDDQGPEVKDRMSDLFDSEKQYLWYGL